MASRQRSTSLRQSETAEEPASETTRDGDQPERRSGGEVAVIDAGETAPALDAQPSLEELIQVTVGNDGRVYLDIDADVTIRIRGDKYEQIDGSDVSCVSRDTAHLSKGHHHIQPTSPEYYDAVMGPAGATPEARELMALRREAYERERKYAEQRERALSRLRKTNRPKKRRGGCSCD